MALLLGVKFEQTADEVYNNNAQICDALNIVVDVQTNYVDPVTGKSFQHTLEVEFDLGYCWDTGEFRSDKMFVRIVNNDAALLEWLALQEIDKKYFEERLLKLLVALYKADNTKYKTYFLSTTGVWFNDWDFNYD